MERFEKELAQRTQPPKTPHGLYESICSRVDVLEQRRARVWGISAFFVACVSVVTTFFSVSYVLERFYTSGFYEYWSLAFSESAVVAYWKEFVLALTESLPVLGMIAVLMSVGVFVWAISCVVRTIRTMHVVAPIRVLR